MKIATWNVNSLKARKEHVLRWLAENKPAVLMIQELKGTDFPTQDIESAGYHAAFVAQKAYNGVAILSRVAPEVVCDRLPGDDSDDQARYLEVTINGIRLINIYAPNGNPVDSEKFLYKQAWLARLKNRLTSLRAGHVPFLVGGDFNIIPADGDCHDPKAWSGDALFRPESRAA
ncbi:MAG: endonuclease/exonuclease/phosphatase family protein, partial [Alphaproteobacteria bacterium]|nr:endonuclease/exonuclease/phosphatase family protein [Alphaproteobacteria bacterium]